MSDIDAAHRSILTDFATQQMNLNPAGIGNECTHWIYAALFEAGALDTDATLKIAQTLPHFTWGTVVSSNDHVQVGDIAQFHGFQNNFFIYLADTAGNSNWLEHTYIRGPNHTGMVSVTPKNGAYWQFESHITDPPETHMHVRRNIIYYDNFAIALSPDDLKKQRGTSAWPADVNTADIKDMRERVDWTGMRQKFSLDLLTATTLQAQVKRSSSSTPTVKGQEIACLFIVRSTGYLRFSCPQASTARLNMNATQLADEKAKLIHMMIASGRTGGSPTEDQYGGDNKAQRLHDNRFDWSYRPSP
jgi:hypothetical protein